MCNKSMWNIDFKTFFTILKQIIYKKILFPLQKKTLYLTSKHVRIPGQVVTTDALQRLCITHVHTRNKSNEKKKFRKIKFQ